MTVLKTLEQQQIAKALAGKTIPEFQPGDTVKVSLKEIGRAHV